VETDERHYIICEFCGEIVLMDDVFAFAEERMLVCRSCTTAQVWSVAGPFDNRDGGRTRS
jgi:hypothetical protein